jgi:addiction module HigA family antidote
LKRHIVEAGGISQDALAKAMDVSRLTVNELINGKRTVTAEMALRLARVLRTSPDLWLDLQRAVDLFKAEQALAPKLEKMPVLR